MSIGVFRFDDPRLCGSGWATLAGGELLRFNSVADLDSSHIWIADIGYQDFVRAKLWECAHVRRFDFARIKPQAVAREVGLDPAKKESLIEVSAVYERVAKILVARTGISFRDANYSLARALSAIDPPSPGIIDISIREDALYAFENASQEIQLYSGRLPRGSGFEILYFPRSAYARFLLSHPLPAAGASWGETRISGGRRVVGTSRGKQVRGTKEWLEEMADVSSRLAVILKVRVLETDPQFAEHSSFGRGAKNGNRVWAALPEVMHLARFCKLEISRGYHCEAEIPEIPDVVGGATYSEGVAAELYWISRTHDAKGKNPMPQGAYLRAYDRIACGLAAERLSSAGFAVSSYGVGRFSVAVPAGAAELFKVARGIGLLHGAR